MEEILGAVTAVVEGGGGKKTELGVILPPSKLLFLLVLAGVVKSIGLEKDIFVCLGKTLD